MNLKRLTWDEVLLIVSGILGIGVAILDLLNWITVPPEGMLQLILALIGTIIVVNVISTNRQEKDIRHLGNQLDQFIVGALDVRLFKRTEYGVEYLTKRISEARDHVDQASLSPPIPRWSSAVKDFEQMIERLAESNEIKIRYLANFADEARKSRVDRLLAKPGINRYFVAYYESDALPTEMMNFVVIDNLEVIIALNSFDGENNIVSIRSSEVTLVFQQYFNLLWSSGKKYMRTPATY